MPKLPSVEQLATHDVSTGGSIATITPGTYKAVADNGEIYEALGNVGKQVADRAVKIQEDMNDTAVQDAINQYNVKRTELELDRRKLKGKDAASKQFVDDSVSQIDMVGTGITATLKNSAQKRKFESLRQQDKVKFGASMAQYSLKQHDIHTAEVFETRLLNNKNRATNNSSFVPEIEGARLDSKDAIEKRGASEGWDEKTITRLVREMDEDLYSGVIDAAIVNDDKNDPNYLNTASVLVDIYGEKLPEAKLDAYNKLINGEKEVKQITDSARLFMDGNLEATEEAMKAETVRLHPEREDLQKAMLTEMKAIKVGAAKDKAAVKEELNQNVAGWFIDGIDTFGLDDIKKSGLENKDQLKWIAAYNTLRTNPKYADDLQLETDLRGRANYAPWGLKTSEIWAKVGKENGLTPGTAQAIQLRRDEALESLKKPGAKVHVSNLALAQKQINELQAMSKEEDSVVFPLDKDDPLKDMYLWNDMRKNLNDEYEKHANAGTLDSFNPVEWVQEKYILPAKDKGTLTFLKEGYSTAFKEPSTYGAIGLGLQANRYLRKKLTGSVTKQDAIDLLRSGGRVVNEESVASAMKYLESK